MVKYSVKSLSTTKQSALVKVRAGQHKPSAGQVHARQLRAQLYISVMRQHQAKPDESPAA